MDLTEGEDIMKRWQEYTEELYKKDLHNPDNHDGVITDLEQTSWNVKSSGPLPEPAGKVDQVPRTCTAGLRKKLKQETTKMGSRGSDMSPRRDAV